MSSDVDDDQVLPESLQKLEIVPVHSQSACKSNNERNQNPFFTESSGLDERITKDLFGPSCSNCESSDKSCGVNNSSSKDVSSRSWRHRGSSVSQCIEHSINKQIHFKHRDKEKSQVLSEKKITILREPILKSIGRSVYHNGHQSCEQKSGHEHEMPKADLSTPTNSSWFDIKLCDQNAGEQIKANCTITSKCETDLGISKTNECQQVPGTSTDASNVMIHRIQNWQLDDESTVDFKSLVNECDNLSLSTRKTAIHSITELHKSKNFQVLQANQIGGAVASTSNATDMNATLLGSSAMNSSLSSNSSNSSSCSQQARMNSSNCDVTIDELASYIEFQLHLPKPMSSNVYEAMFS